MAAEKRPFVEDGSQFGVSRAAFRKMRKAEKRGLMIQWFHQHFDRPDNVGTPWVDGEYLWIWGGPYNAEDQLYLKFEGVANEKLIKEVAEEVESSEDITEWGRHQTQEDFDEDDEPPGIQPLDQFSDEPSDAYGSPAEQDARSSVRAALDELQRKLDEFPPGIGHNNPPEDIEPGEDIELIRSATTALRVEFSKPNPVISRIKSWAKPLRAALIATGKWAGRKVDKAVDAAIVIAMTYFAQHPEVLADAFNKIINWLEIGAKLVMHAF